MTYKKIDINKWKRKEHFLYYQNSVRCGFSLTTKIEISKVLLSTKERSFKFYPTIIYLISKAVNLHSQFRLAMKDNELIMWNVIHPAYTVMHAETETFSELCTQYTDDIQLFINDFEKTSIAYQNNLGMSPMDLPQNSFSISSIPWVSFDGFNLNVADFTNYFPPIITIGKYFEEDDKILLPFAIQVNHSTCDGLHVGKLINTLQEFCDKSLDV